MINKAKNEPAAVGTEANNIRSMYAYEVTLTIYMYIHSDKAPAHIDSWKGPARVRPAAHAPAASG